MIFGKHALAVLFAALFFYAPVVGGNAPPQCNKSPERGNLYACRAGSGSDLVDWKLARKAFWIDKPADDDGGGVHFNKTAYCKQFDCEARLKQTPAVRILSCLCETFGTRCNVQPECPGVWGGATTMQQQQQQQSHNGDAAAAATAKPTEVAVCASPWQTPTIYVTAALALILGALIGFVCVRTSLRDRRARILVNAARRIVAVIMPPARNCLARALVNIAAPRIKKVNSVTARQILREALTVGAQIIRGAGRRMDENDGDDAYGDYDAGPIIEELSDEEEEVQQQQQQGGHVNLVMGEAGENDDEDDEKPPSQFNASLPSVGAPPYKSNNQECAQQ